ncbi:hypothetical protein A9Q86_12255 [Flavobacteriales bacterium 33_180_T64]|nr:hypothetical protein A9Q86_12255 [Flavobacteriales bacterium 33_180_T64]
MKSVISIVFYLFFINASSQNYKLIDEKVKNYPKFHQIETLVLRVDTSFKTKEEKARAYYTWISYNITYDLNRYHTIEGPNLEVTFNSERLNKCIENHNRSKLANRIFKTRRALCMGFSTLFQELCLRSNIEVKIIEGITKVSVDDLEHSNYIKNHAWNAVKIKNKWQLIDLSWSSGYENTNTGKWVTAFNDFYFFTNPEELITTHFPADSKFQLLEKSLNFESFFQQPVVYNKYFESGLKISDYQKGLINVSKKDKKIRLSFKNRKKDTTIYYKFDDDTYLKELQLIKKEGSNNFVAALKYKSRTSEVLSLYYQNEKILDFKIEK